MIIFRVDVIGPNRKNHSGFLKNPT